MNSMTLTPQPNGLLKIELQQRVGELLTVSICLHLDNEAANVPMLSLQARVLDEAARALAMQSEAVLRLAQTPNIQQG